ncbi:unnamed protein product [Brachionus calyciflorus]|uniref:Uncharacterized protein n=1 Tax=Brachionus calyciflorus TaxID=104777 RepID=A0A813R5C2_9BILA|nr:unnamed protein product [Brachionus calyciflorus]
MYSTHKSLAEVPGSNLRTPTITSRMSHLNQTPRSGSKIPSVNNSKIPGVRTPGINTPTSRFMSANNNSAKSINSSMNRSGIPSVKPPSTPTTRTPLSRTINSARTAPNPSSSQARSLIPKTPSTFRPNFNSRLTAASNLQTPKRKSSFLDQKKISRTVDCAKSIKRRSIKILNQSSTRLSFLNEMESGCVVITPKLFKHLMSKSSNKIEESILEKDETETLNDEDLKVRTIEPQNLLKYLLKDKKEDKNNSFKVEITVNLNPNNSNLTDAQQLQVKVDTKKIESALNCKDTDQIELKLKEIPVEIVENKIECEKNNSELIVPDKLTEEKVTNETINNENKKEETVTLKIEPEFNSKGTTEDCHRVVNSIETENISEGAPDVEVNSISNNEDCPQVVNSIEIENITAPDTTNAVVQEIIEVSPIEITNDLIEEVTKTQDLIETIPFEISEDEDEIEKKIPDEIIVESKEEIEEKNENYECKEISLQTDFKDESVCEPFEHKVEDTKFEKVEEIVSEDVKEEVEVKSKSRAVSKPRRGRKPKEQEVESEEGNENSSEEIKNTPAKGRRGRAKQKEVQHVEMDKQSEEPKRVLTRARAKLTAIN